MKRVYLECGGKSPNIILDDVPELRAAAERAAQSAENTAQAAQSVAAATRTSGQCSRREAGGDAVELADRGELLAQQVVFRPQGAAERDDLGDFVFQHVEFIEHARTIVS